MRGGGGNTWKIPSFSILIIVVFLFLSLFFVDLTKHHLKVLQTPPPPKNAALTIYHAECSPIYHAEGICHAEFIMLNSFWIYAEWKTDFKFNQWHHAKFTNFDSRYNPFDELKSDNHAYLSEMVILGDFRQLVGGFW